MRTARGPRPPGSRLPIVDSGKVASLAAVCFLAPWLLPFFHSAGKEKLTAGNCNRGY